VSCRHARTGPGTGNTATTGAPGPRLDWPGLDALRDAAEAGLFEVVWCLSPDRLARSSAY
jgi:site-specific DNA recombinase